MKGFLVKMIFLCTEKQRRSSTSSEASSSQPNALDFYCLQPRVILVLYSLGSRLCVTLWSSLWVPADTCFPVLDGQTPVYSCVHKMGMLSVPYLQSCITQFPYSNVHASDLVGMGRVDRMQNVQLMQVELGCTCRDVFFVH